MALLMSINSVCAFSRTKEFPPKYHSAKVTTAAVTTVITSVLTTSIGFAGVS